MTAEVIQGGVVKDHKGVNLPDTLLPIPALTPKDRADLDYALQLTVDWLALSFVQRADDVAELRKAAGRAGVLSRRSRSPRRSNRSTRSSCSPMR